MSDEHHLDKQTGATPPEVLEYKQDRKQGLVFDYPERREIPASRIRRLARKFGSKVGVPVNINNAVITGDLVLPGAHFTHGLSITESVLKGAVDLTGATFEGGLDLHGSRFEGEADFTGAHVRGDCDLTRAEFAQPCHFDDAQIEGSLTGVGARFEKEAGFKQLRVAGSVSFRCHTGEPAPPGPDTPAAPPQTVATVFGGKLHFSRAVIEGQVSFEGAQFAAEVDFQRARINHTTDFSSYAEGDAKPLLSITRFESAADFTACQIAGGAAFLGVYFKGFARFERIQVGGHLLFKPRQTADGPVQSFFESGASFLCARVHNNAEFDGAFFVGNTSFDHLEVERNAYFRPAFHAAVAADDDGPAGVPTVFFGGADFIGARIRGDAEFTGAMFWQKVRLESIHVEGNAFFDDVYDPFDRRFSKTSPVIFLNEVNLVSAHFLHRATFDRAVFLGPAKFESADFEGAALFNGTYFGGAVNFTGASFGQYAKFVDSTFAAAADFTSTRVGGAAFFGGAALLGPTSFTAASFKSLEFGLREPPDGRQTFGRALDLSGFTYELISINEKVLDDIFGSMVNYNRQSLTQLERVLRNIGHDDLADNTYLRRRDKERAAKWKRLKGDFREVGFTNWAAARRAANGVTGLFFDFAQSVVGNYGIRPFRRLLAISLGVLFFGALMFWREGAVVPRVRDEKTSVVVASLGGDGAPALVVAAPMPTPTPVQLGFTQAVGVSFNQFIPIVQIPSGSRWKPSEKPIPLPNDWSFTYFSYAMYGTIHSLLGAILVPLGVAALTGVLHRREKPGK